jgi:hypothetical protein
VALALVALAGCGGDDEPDEPATTVPDLTVPGRSETEDAAPPVTTVPPAPVAPPTDTSGGAPAPPVEQPDSPENDTPPPPESPAERFEQFCDANPGACG